MLAKKITTSFLVFVSILLAQGIAFGAISEASEMEKQKYKQEMARIKAMRKSLSPELDKESFQKDPDGYMKQLMASRDKNDLDAYERFADEIQNKWNKKNKEHYARLMLEVCGPITSGDFKGNQRYRYQLARKYALSALEKPDEIPLTLELELTGRVITLMIGPYVSKGADFAQRRKKDIEIRLHAWKRLVEAIDSTWDPNKELLSPNAVAANMGFPGTIEPESIKDPKIRAEYEAAIEENIQEIKRYTEQNRLQKWLKRFPRHAEPYIIQAYSKPPFNLEELKQYLDNYIADKKTNARIVNAVIKNVEKQTKDP